MHSLVMYCVVSFVGVVTMVNICPCIGELVLYNIMYILAYIIAVLLLVTQPSYG